MGLFFLAFFATLALWLLVRLALWLRRRAKQKKKSPPEKAVTRRLRPEDTIRINGLSRDEMQEDRRPELEELFTAERVSVGWVCPACEGENEDASPCCQICGRAREEV